MSPGSGSRSRARSPSLVSERGCTLSPNRGYNRDVAAAGRARPASGLMAKGSLSAWAKAVFPIVAQLESYRSDLLKGDITAGLAIAAVALPIGVAYPAIAGLPPVVGLYASILPLVGYAVFGSSRQLVVGPDAATLAILAASLSQISMTGSAQQRVVTSAAFAIAVGVMCLLSGALRLGFIANFLSRPILTGYLCGISLTLLTSQIGRLTTVHMEAKGFLRPLIELSGQLSKVHVPTLVFGAAILLLLRLLKWWSPRSPGPLVAVIIATLLSFLFNLEASLVFFNIDHVRDRIRWIADRLPHSTRWFILDAEAVTTIDSTAAAVLGEIKEELSRRNLRFGVANLHAQPRQLLARSGFLASIGAEMSFTHIEDAALAFRRTAAERPAE